MKHLPIIAITLTMAIAPCGGAAAAVATFEDLSLAPESASPGGVVATFVSGGATFFTHPLGGWRYSNTTDVTTGNFTNDTSAYHLPAGGGANGSSNFGVAFDGSSFDPPFQSPFPRVEFGRGVLVNGAYLTNATYPALVIRDGSPPFSEPFGGASGDDPDFFSVDVIGLAGGSEVGRVNFVLADYRFSDPALDYIVDGWEWVNLATLGVVDALEFQLTSTDAGSFGLNTPVYFALDDLTFTPVPLPASILLMVPALVGLRRYRATSLRA